MSIEWTNVRVKLGALRPWAQNPRHITRKQAERLAESFSEFGQVETVAIGPDGDVYNGHQRLSVLLKLHGPEYEVDARQSSRSLTDDERKKLVVFLHAGAVGGWSWDALSGWEAADLMQWGFDGDTLQAWKGDIAALGNLIESETPEPADAEPQIDRAEELQKKWGTATGQLWRIGDHRLLVGDSTKREDVERVMQGEKADCLITDPPYCSGGFQEAGKKSGSIGTRGDEMIANDTLSTRGYIALIKSVLSLSDCGVVYIFTDWRMWVNLFDVCESSGFGVRNMIVWDKQTPGMGRGWRSQHELIMAAMRVTQPFDPHKAQGNVIQCNRTGNVLHPTEKPIELLQKILDVSDIAKVVYDPFCGSGPCLVACQNLSRRCRAIEIAPQYVSVCLERMSMAFPGIEIERIAQ